MLIATLAVLLLALSTSLERVEGRSFRLSLSQVLRQAGLEENSNVALTEDQTRLIEALGQIYASDDELEGDEEQMLAKLTHNTKEIMELKAIFNKHLINSLTVDKLAAELRESLEKSRQAASQQVAAGAA